MAGYRGQPRSAYSERQGSSGADAVPDHGHYPQASESEQFTLVDVPVMATNVQISMVRRIH
jgi:hypothetical protein